MGPKNLSEKTHRKSGTVGKRLCKGHELSGGFIQAGTPLEIQTGGCAGRKKKDTLLPVCRAELHLWEGNQSEKRGALTQKLWKTRKVPCPGNLVCVVKTLSIGGRDATMPAKETPRFWEKGGRIR